MTAAGTALLLVLQIPLQTAASDSLLLLAAESPATILVARARTRPAELRESFRSALARSVSGATAAERERSLTAARRLAEAHASAWDDPFLVNELQRFASGPPEWRRAKLHADSLRRAGVAAYGRAGLRAALPLWRESVRRAAALGDSASMAAGLGNVGVVFFRESRLDSAEVTLLRARALAAAVGDRVVEGNAVGTLALVSLDRGDLVLARERLDEAIALRGRVGDVRGAAADHNTLGHLLWEVGDLDGARRQFEAALVLSRGEGWDDVAATNLTNLAALASLVGDFERALALYDEALETYREAELWLDAADVLRGLGQLELRRGDYRAARGAFLEALSLYERTGPATDAIAVHRELASALAAMGEMQGALDELGRAERSADSLRAPVEVRAGLALARADLAVAMNTLEEAERRYAAAERLYAEAGDAAGRAEARQGQGLLLLEREEWVRAEQVLASAVRAQEAVGNRRGAALTRMLLAEARVERGDPDGARALLGHAAGDLADLGDPVAEAAALGELAELEAEAGLILVADSLYVAALGRLGQRPAPDVRWRLHLGRALAARSTGSVDAAARQLQAAVAEVERAAASLVLPERRSAFRADKWDVYAELALTERMRGRLAGAFEASERLRARETLEVLHRGRLLPPPGIAGDLAAREHDLRVRIAELSRETEPRGAGLLRLRGPASPGSTAADREAVARAREAYAELLLEMRERAPRQAELVAVEVSEWRDVARRLAPDAALIEYLVTDSGSVAFVVTGDTIVAVDLGIGRRDLARLVEFTRAVLENTPPTGDVAWRAPLQRLHRHLIRPVEETGLLNGKDRLVLVPHAELHYLPFAALLGPDGRFVVERYALASAPSASVWLGLGDRQRRSSGQEAVLALAPRPGALPASLREVAAVERLAVGGATVLRGAAASEEVFRRAARGYGILHLATYGVLNKHNPLFSFVDLAPGDGHDGRLEVHEVFGLDLAADLVVLSACQTALGSGALADVPEGDDWVGLTRAFLHAGASRVIATLWAVEDRATAELMEGFYERRAAGADDVSALAHAQRAMLRKPATAHPFHWAGVVLVGDGGGDGR